MYVASDFNTLIFKLHLLRHGKIPSIQFLYTNFTIVVTLRMALEDLFYHYLSLVGLIKLLFET